MENQTAPAANENPNGPMLAIQSVYLKDCSYEAPEGSAHRRQLEPADLARHQHHGQRRRARAATKSC